MRRSRRSMTVVLGLAAAVGAGCAEDLKVVRYKPFFAGLEGAESQTPEIGEERVPLPDPAPGDDRIIIELPNGDVRLVSRTVRDLMSHIERTLDEGDFEAFEAYVLSQKTKEHLASEGKTAQEFFKVMQNSRRAIAKTFGRMPFGERTPSCLFEKAGPRMFVLKLTGLAARDVPYTKLWVAYEGGEYRFVWLS